MTANSCIIQFFYTVYPYSSHTTSSPVTQPLFNATFHPAKLPLIWDILFLTKGCPKHKNFNLFVFCPKISLWFSIKNLAFYNF